jgi:type IV fimbrial biogenesis protein FimT
MRGIADRAAQRGITLVELMITIVIFVILTLMALPTWSTWMASQQVRSVTESVLDGIRVAQTEAIKRNQQVRWVIDTSNGWKAELVSDDSVLREGVFKEGGGKVAFTTTPSGMDTVVFDGLGRIFKADGVTALDARITYDIATSTGFTGARALRVVIDTAAAGGVGFRSCDPNASADPKRACPT